jgi:hypothetical protein
MKVWAGSILPDPALLGKGVVLPIDSVLRSHQWRIRNHKCLGELGEVRSGDVDQGQSTSVSMANDERRPATFSVVA